jgi:pantoate--beta-alanine ligase
MIRVETIAALRRNLNDWRQRDERIALVPTMGNLHAGHLQLVRRAREVGDRVVVSIFVNPTQFGEGEDFGAYPRTLGEDAQALKGAGADLLFSPSVSEVYRRPREQLTLIRVPGISEILCGASRPGHFDGVATVVCKLFNMVQPDLALFGEKDFQQLLVIRRVTEDLDLPVEIIGVPTVREKDGLAMSSRNAYLTAEERKIAPNLQRILREIVERVRGGESNLAGLKSIARAELTELGFRPDYLEIRRAADLAPPTPEDRRLVVLTAAHLGGARLIDNLPFRR